MSVNEEIKGTLPDITAKGFDAASISSEIRSLEEEMKVTRGKRPKRAKKLTRLERTKRLHDRVFHLVEELEGEGFASLLLPPPPVLLVGPEVEDPKTEGKIGHAMEPLGRYIRRVSVQDNFFQRPPFDHVTDAIYRRLIRDFIDGAAMPESKIAALSSSGDRAHSLQEGEIQYSIIDGLQRLYCFLIAILLVWRRDELVKDGIIPQEAWKFFAESVGRQDNPRKATEDLLRRTIRFEIFYGISLAGLLHYMVTFNTSQRRMSLRVQLEIMQRPLIEQLKSDGIPIWEDIGKMPREQKPREKFPASVLVLATQAFITNNAHVTAGAETERFLDENQPYLDNVGDVSDVIKTLRRITMEIHPKIMQVYAGDPNKRYLILCESSFLLGFIAACGYVRNRGGMMILDRAFDKLMGELNKFTEDPINLESYQEATSLVASSRGKAARRLVDDTFRRFFLGVTTELEWLDTARQISAGVA
ncbi:MAG: hypothetical protein ACE5HC_13055 [Candidatus Binatia bacterium]